MALTGGTRADSIVQEWHVKVGDEGLKSVDDLNKKIIREQREEKKLARVRAELDKRTASATKETIALGDSTAKAGGSIRTASQSMLGQITAGNLLAGALTRAKDAVGQLWADMDRYSQVAQSFHGDLERMRTATSGLVSATDLMTAHNKLMITGVRASSTEFDQVLEATTKLSRAMGIDLKQSMDQVITGVARGSVLRLDDIGIIVDQTEAVEQYAIALGVSKDALTEVQKKDAIWLAFLDKAKKKSEELGDVVVTAAERMRQAKIRFYDGVQEKTTSIVGNAVEQWEFLALEVRRDFHMMKTDAEDHAAALTNSGDALARLRRLQDEVAASALALSAVYRAQADASEIMVSTLTRHIERQVAIGTQAAQELNKILAKMATARAKQRKTRAPTGGGELFGEAAEFQSEFGVGGISSGIGGEVADAGSRVTFMNAAAEASARLTAELRRQNAEWDKNARATLAVQKQLAGTQAINSAAKESIGMLTEGLAQMAGAFWGAADAAIMGTDTLGMALAKSLKSILLNMATEATVKGMMALAEFAATKDPSQLVAAGLFFGVAAVAGGAGLGVSAGIKAGGGYDKKEKPTSSTSTVTQSFGTRVENKQPIYINLYLNPRNPSAALLWKKQIDAQIKQAA